MQRAFLEKHSSRVLFFFWAPLLENCTSGAFLPHPSQGFCLKAHLAQTLSASYCVCHEFLTNQRHCTNTMNWPANELASGSTCLMLRHRFSNNISSTGTMKSPASCVTEFMYLCLMCVCVCHEFGNSHQYCTNTMRTLRTQ